MKCTNIKICLNKSSAENVYLNKYFIFDSLFRNVQTEISYSVYIIKVLHIVFDASTTLFDDRLNSFKDQSSDFVDQLNACSLYGFLDFLTKLMVALLLDHCVQTILFQFSSLNLEHVLY